ncbi:hypothetical protein LIER_01168 [Lithospermum erythrorhizon]|uniref:Uncharacterized protein n=1 Tax=Lithospermum erythrorhizon TaxID=34254 RepID=A0AAV3NNL7_LITER
MEFNQISMALSTPQNAPNALSPFPSNSQISLDSSGLRSKRFVSKSHFGRPELSSVRHSSMPPLLWIVMLLIRIGSDEPKKAKQGRRKRSFRKVIPTGGRIKNLLHNVNSCSPRGQARAHRKLTEKENS